MSNGCRHRRIYIYIYEQIDEQKDEWADPGINGWTDGLSGVVSNEVLNNAVRMDAWTSKRMFIDSWWAFPKT